MGDDRQRQMRKDCVLKGGKLLLNYKMFFVMNYKNKKGHGKVPSPCFYIFVHSISLYVVLSFVDILFVF